MVATARIALATQFIPSYSLVSANCEPIYYIVPWVYASLHPKQYLERFGHLCRAHGCTHQIKTHRQTYRPRCCTTCVAIARI